jgi:hypothetical protein
MASADIPRSFAGQAVAAGELKLIREVVDSCGGVSRTELAKTVCELLGWRRPNGSLRGLECREYLEQLTSCGYLHLPEKRRRRPVGSSTRIPHTPRGDRGEAVVGSVADLGPIILQEARDAEARQWFRELVGRYHYQGYSVAYGAQLCYLIFATQPERRVLGCVRFSSPAWRMAARDGWIGWDDSTRARNLQRVVNNSRFLLLPWIQVRNLASRVLSLAAKQLVVDWPARYGVEPLLLETLVDGERFSGTCYRAANWIEVGETSGRGRMDRAHERHGASPKKVLLYPLVRDVAPRLRAG